MPCPHFKSKYDIGVCSVSGDPHVPGIDEMGRFCFKDDYNACSIFRGCFAQVHLPQKYCDSAHINHYMPHAG